ncbi:MAG: hypothetical protein RBT69_06735 [Spirochaetia bacterium]|nr:hypothetical protein [Spirochaetia bacterium]
MSPVIILHFFFSSLHSLEKVAIRSSASNPITLIILIPIVSRIYSNLGI